MIRETLCTVVGQTFADMEILVKADGTDDRTEEEVLSVGDPRIIFSQSPTHLGIPRILNSLIVDSCGEYVIILHDHDKYHPKLIEKMVNALDTFPRALFVHAGLEQYDPKGKYSKAFVGNYQPLTPGRNWLAFMLSRFDCPVCAMSMVRRNTYEQLGLYSPEYGFVADVEMWMRLSRHGDVAYIPEVMMYSPTREEDHESRFAAWHLVDAILKIHENFRELEGVNSKFRNRVDFEIRAEKYRISCFLSAMKHTGFSRSERRKARDFLAARGGVVTSVLARMIPT